MLVSPFLAAIALFTPLVAAHGKLIAPLGLNVDTSVDLSSEADVALGVGATACGFVLGKGAVDQTDMSPRASFAAGSDATATYHIVNIDGAGPVSVAFSGDSGATWTKAAVSVNAPGAAGINPGNLLSGADAPVTFSVPNMACAAGSCLMRVNNPLTFGSCSPVQITQGSQNQMLKTYNDPTGKAPKSG
ncbi:hypothetical protein HKX48_008151 [Thoreauomyces humboldtii]|nr:hypothetical protein HKX48_008151 [Thoreauomyces humboldtii]